MDHPISSRGRLARGILVLVLGGGTLLGPSIARAQDKADDFADEKRCERRFTVLSPMPASCLEPIETDRPDKTDTVATVPAGHAQVEVGIAEYEIERVAGASDNNLTIGNNIYKLGIADKLGPIKGWDLQVLHALGSYGVRARRFQASPDVMVRTKLRFVDGPLQVTVVLP